MDYAAGRIENTGASISKYLIVSVNGSSYAIRVAFIHKIVVLSHISFLPHVEPYILGATRADGEIYTVVDLRILFGKTPEISQGPTAAVLMLYGKSKICAVADRVISVIDIDTECVIRPLIGKHYISGVAQIDNRIISILAVDKLFSKIADFLHRGACCWPRSEQ